MRRAVNTAGSDSNLQKQTTEQARSSAASAGENQPQKLPMPSDAELVAAFNREYEECWHEETKPYPGILELLAFLQATGYRLGIISNKPDLFTKKIAAHFFPTINFDFVTGMKPDRPAKPDPALALEICQKTGISPQETALIGDSSVDMKTAVAAGMLPIGVLWGFRDKAELQENGAKYLVASAEELALLLLSMFDN
ncbi:MAG: HAD family hydrolase [Ruminococcaceae bacterium]|nr:HAD family hydrolase [Oscillospiraceae bacterium]